MYARKVAVRLKPHALQEFNKLIEVAILPWLRQQEGFLDLIVLAALDGSEVATISFWEHETHAEAYQAWGYLQTLEILASLLDGRPYVKTFHVVSSTLQDHPGSQGERSPEQQTPAQENGPSPSDYRSWQTSL